MSPSGLFISGPDEFARCRYTSAQRGGPEVCDRAPMATLKNTRSRIRPSTCSLVRIDPDMLWMEGWLRAGDLSLFHGVRFETAGVALRISVMLTSSS
jgi:hypothetical protein